MTSLATVSILVFGLFLIKPLLLVLKIKRTVLMPVIFLLCTVCAFAAASRLFRYLLRCGIGSRSVLPSAERDINVGRLRGLGLVLAAFWNRAASGPGYSPTAVSEPFFPADQHRLRY